MAKILDPDAMTRASTLPNLGTDWNIFIDTTTKLISIDAFGTLVDTAPSSTSGVTMQCVYSFLKEEWKTDAALIKFPFPVVSITNEQFELVSGWDFADATTKNLIRDWGWALKTAGVSLEEYMNVTTLGAFDDSGADNAYYLQEDGGTPADIVLTGEVNQAVKIYGDAANGNFDYRAFFKAYLREQGKTFGFWDLIVDQNISALTYKKYALPLSNGTDLKVTENDTNIGANAPYTGMSITYFDAIDDGWPQSRTIGASSYDFSIIIDWNNGTAEEIYEFVQYQLRQTGDIDDDLDTLRWDTAEELLKFVWDTLKTQNTSLGGVFIDNFQPADTNRITFEDDLGIERTFPFVAAWSINFNDNLQNSTDAVYTMFFTNDDAWDNAGADYGTAAAIIVDNNAGTDLSGAIWGSPSIAFDFDYDGNIQRGAASAWLDAPVTIVAIGTDTAQFVKATWTIIRSTANNFSLVWSLERNYSNPA